MVDSVSVSLLGGGGGGLDTVEANCLTSWNSVGRGLMCSISGRKSGGKMQLTEG